MSHASLSSDHQSDPKPNQGRGVLMLLWTYEGFRQQVKTERRNLEITAAIILCAKWRTLQVEKKNSQILRRFSDLNWSFLNRTRGCWCSGVMKSEQSKQQHAELKCDSAWFLTSRTWSTNISGCFFSTRVNLLSYFLKKITGNNKKTQHTALPNVLC